MNFTLSNIWEQRPNFHDTVRFVSGVDPGMSGAGVSVHDLESGRVLYAQLDEGHVLRVERLARLGCLDQRFSYMAEHDRRHGRQLRNAMSNQLAALAVPPPESGPTWLAVPFGGFRAWYRSGTLTTRAKFRASQLALASTMDYMRDRALTSPDAVIVARCRECHSTCVARAACAAAAGALHHVPFTGHLTPA